MVPYVFEQQRNPRHSRRCRPSLLSERIECAGLAGGLPVRGRLHPGQVAAVVSDSATALVDAFYSTLLSDAEAGPRLSHEIVSTRLSSAMKGWLKGLLCVRDQGDIAALMATQKRSARSTRACTSPFIW
ncbi:hypothetical protein WJ970_30465 [Achromobacter xylosoxidans]